MPFAAWIGLPRSGKSYNVVELVILPALKTGRRIVTNLPLLVDRIPDANELVTLVTLEELQRPGWTADAPKGAVFVFDEAHLVWPATGRVLAAEWSEWFSMHGHQVGEDGFVTEIVIVTQDLTKVNTRVRSDVDTTYVVRKLSILGTPTRYQVDVYEGAVSRDSARKEKRVRRFKGKYRPEIYSYYRSHTQSQTGQAGQEVKTFEGATIWRAAPVIVGIPIGVLLIGVLGYYFAQYWYIEPARKRDELRAQLDAKKAREAQAKATMIGAPGPQWDPQRAHELVRESPVPAPGAWVENAPEVKAVEVPTPQACGLPASGYLRIVGVMAGPEVDVVAVYDARADQVFPLSRSACRGEQRNLCCATPEGGIAWWTGNKETTHDYPSTSDELPPASGRDIRRHRDGAGPTPDVEGEPGAS